MDRVTVTPLTAQVFPNIPTMTYGRYACRFSAISVTLGWTVKIGLLPADNVLPDHGEIEYPTGDLSDDVLIMFTPALPTGAPAGVSAGAQWTAWHIAVIEWKPSSLKCFLDGVQVYSNTVNVPNTPMVFSIRSTGNSATDAHLLLDWVAAWSV